MHGTYPWFEMVVRCALALMATVLALPASVAARTMHYVLTAESRLAYSCDDCDAPTITSEPLHGSFDLTVMPISTAYAFEAVTAVDWQSDSFAISGAGFLQRIATDRLAMVLEVRTNGISTLLTTEQPQPSTPGEIRLQLASPPDDDHLAVTIVAVPAVTAGSDADGDGIADDFDNCPMSATADQHDGDRDGVGDACDACPGTLLASPVLSDGCAPSQRCPCEGPAPDEEWSSQRAYVQCVARNLKELRDGGRLSRSNIRRMLQDAVRSGCGRRLLALL